MAKNNYFSEMGGHPDQTNLLTDRLFLLMHMLLFQRDPCGIS